MHRRCILTTALILPFAGLGHVARAGRRDWVFPSIDGGVLSFGAWQGRPVLVVNTASRCGFTRQYDALQSLHERYADQGLIVLAVPSGDFRQELGSDEEVQEYCEVNFNLTLPMTTITPILGQKAHPFYRWMKQAQGWSPNWNFNKVLIAPDGNVAGTWRATTGPNATDIVRRIESFL